jgi:uncharacterized protein YutE (UPF0331/DUF86 family)
MYYVNEEQIWLRLHFIPFLQRMADHILKMWKEGNGNADQSAIYSLAQERLLHLAVETVTDVGSMLIDGFMLREASSYEDIIRVLADEQMFSEEAAKVLDELARLRKPLVQQYVEWERGKVHELLETLPQVLEEFRTGVIAFMRKELPEIFSEGDR